LIYWRFLTSKLSRKQRNVTAALVGQASAAFSYDFSADMLSSEGGLYSDKTNVTFDDFKAFDASVRPATTPRSGGLVDP